MKCYIGIDCGISGGIGVIDENGIMLASEVMPTVKTGKGNKIDIAMLRKILFAPIGKIVTANPAAYTFIIEDPGAHAPSASGLRSMTYCFAVAETLVFLTGCRYHTVLSQRWQKEFWSRPKMPKGKKFNTKAAALECARKLWPNQQFKATDRSTKAHDGIVDALLIAEYGRRTIK